MGHKVETAEKVDINVMPVTGNFNAHNTSVTFGDLHGHFLKGIYLLKQQGIIDLSEANYQSLLEISQKSAGELTQEDLQQFYFAIQSITRVENIPNDFLIRFIGDVLADRGPNDWFTLKFLEQLKTLGFNLEIMFSNHDHEFIERFKLFKYHEGNFSQIINPWSDNVNNSNSSGNFHKLISKLGRDEIIATIEKVYLPTVRAISYSLVLNNQGEVVDIQLYTHAPAAFDVIEKLAVKYQIPYKAETVLEFISTIDAINVAFNKQELQSDKSTILASEIDIVQAVIDNLNRLSPATRDMLNLDEADFKKLEAAKRTKRFEYFSDLDKTILKKLYDDIINPLANDPEYQRNSPFFQITSNGSLEGLQLPSQQEFLSLGSGKKYTVNVQYVHGHTGRPNPDNLQYKHVKNLDAENLAVKYAIITKERSQAMYLISDDLPAFSFWQKIGKYVLTQEELAKSTLTELQKRKETSWIDVVREKNTDKAVIEIDYDRGRFASNSQGQLFFNGKDDIDFDAMFAKFFEEHKKLGEQLIAFYSQDVLQIINKCLSIAMIETKYLMWHGHDDTVANFKIVNGELFAEIKKSNLVASNPQTLRVNEHGKNIFDEIIHLPGSVSAVFKLKPKQGFELQTLTTSNAMLKSMLMGEAIDFENEQVRHMAAKEEKVFAKAADSQLDIETRQFFIAAAILQKAIGDKQYASIPRAEVAAKAILKDALLKYESVESSEDLSELTHCLNRIVTNAEQFRQEYAHQTWRESIQYSDQFKLPSSEWSVVSAIEAEETPKQETADNIEIRYEQNVKLLSKALTNPDQKKDLLFCIASLGAQPFLEVNKNAQEKLLQTFNAKFRGIDLTRINRFKEALLNDQEAVRILTANSANNGWVVPILKSHAELVKEKLNQGFLGGLRQKFKGTDIRQVLDAQTLVALAKEMVDPMDVLGDILLKKPGFFARLGGQPDYRTMLLDDETALKDLMNVFCDKYPAMTDGSKNTTFLETLGVEFSATFNEVVAERIANKQEISSIVSSERSDVSDEEIEDLSEELDVLYEERKALGQQFKKNGSDARSDITLDTSTDDERERLHGLGNNAEFSETGSRDGSRSDISGDDERLSQDTGDYDSPIISGLSESSNNDVGEQSIESSYKRK